MCAQCASEVFIHTLADDAVSPESGPNCISESVSFCFVFLPLTKANSTYCESEASVFLSTGW